MLQDAHRTSAPSAWSVSMSTAVWMVMWSEPVMRCPASGCRFAYSCRTAMSPGISFSARSSSLRPHSARPRSFTLNSRRAEGLFFWARAVLGAMCVVSWGTGGAGGVRRYTGGPAQVTPPGTSIVLRPDEAGPAALRVPVARLERPAPRDLVLDPHLVRVLPLVDGGAEQPAARVPHVDLVRQVLAGAELGAVEGDAVQGQLVREEILERLLRERAEGRAADLLDRDASRTRLEVRATGGDEQGELPFVHGGLARQLQLGLLHRAGDGDGDGDGGVRVSSHRLDVEQPRRDDIARELDAPALHVEGVPADRLDPTAQRLDRAGEQEIPFLLLRHHVRLELDVHGRVVALDLEAVRDEQVDLDLEWRRRRRGQLRRLLAVERRHHDVGALIERLDLPGGELRGQLHQRMRDLELRVDAAGRELAREGSAGSDVGEVLAGARDGEVVRLQRAGEVGRRALAGETDRLRLDLHPPVAVPGGEAVELEDVVGERRLERNAGPFAELDHRRAPVLHRRGAARNQPRQGARGGEVRLELARGGADEPGRDRRQEPEVERVRLQRGPRGRLPELAAAQRRQPQVRLGVERAGEGAAPRAGELEAGV